LETENKTYLTKRLRIKAVNIPVIKPGIEKKNAYIIIVIIIFLLLKPSALNIPN
jgi:hypothetical protein